MRVKSFVSVGMVIALLSCSGDGSTLDPTGNPLGPAQIEVTPASINLSLQAGTLGSIVITITNVGGFTLEVGGLTSASSFIVTPQFFAPINIGTGESIDIDVVIDASDLSASTFQGTVEISSNDEEAPIVTVIVNLNVTAQPEPEIDVSPLSFDVSLATGESDTISVTVSNLGSADLILTSINSNDSFITLLTSSATVASGNSTILRAVVSSVGLQQGTFQGMVEIVSNDSDEPVVIVTVSLVVALSGPFPATLTAIQQNVFTPRCALSGCHAGAAPAAGQSLEAGQAFVNIVGVQSTEVPSLLRVNPGNPDDSYLVIKIVETDPRRVGSRMPRTGPPFLDQDVIEVIKTWIAEGAQDN